LPLACAANEPSIPPPDGATIAVSFDQGGVLTLAPKDAVAIDLSASGLSTVSLSLVGNYLDAFLDADAVDASSGHASVMLHAPSSASSFSVLAASGAASARLDVAVSSTGFATVRVTVDYQGKRAVPIVAASTFVEQTCAEVGTSATDGAPLVFGTSGDELVIPSVPTDGRVAVAVRIAHYATGCFDITSLTPNETRDVTVPVFDLPLDLADSTLETRFTFTPDSNDSTALVAYFAEVAETVLGASFATSGSESSTLLDAMGAASTSPTAFASARNQKDWDATVATWLGQHTPSMHDRAAVWMTEAALGSVGDLTGHIVGAPSKPVFTPLMLGALDAATSGVSAPEPFAWSGQPNDVLSLTGSIVVVPSELACAAADARARIDAPPAQGVASALVTAIDCSGLGTELAQGGDVFAQCDASCVSDLCATALTTEWTAGSKSLSKTTDALTLSITVAAPVQVGDTADVESYTGTWLGSFSTNATNVSTNGVAKGATGAIPN
jgi:hypothetical protein